MKHEITTYNTKRMLADTLKNLMKTKPFSKITVSEIIKECGVNRKTFYYHFSDIYGLLKWMFEEEAVEVVKHFDLLEDYDSALYFVLKYVEENDYIINCAYDSMGRDEMKRFFYTDFVGGVRTVIDEAEKKFNKEIEPGMKDYVAKFYTEALSGMLIEIVKERDHAKRERAVEYLTKIIEVAIESIVLG